MKKKIKIRLLLSFILVFIIVCLVILISYNAKKQDKIVAKINNNTIYESTVRDIMYKEYYDFTLNEIVDDILLLQEAEKLSIDTSGLNIENMSNKDNINQNTQVLQLIHKLVATRLDEEKLKNYFDENLKGTRKIDNKEVWYFNIDHIIGTDLIVEYKLNNSVDDAIKKLKITENMIDKSIISSIETELFEQVEGINDKEMKMIMEGDDHKVVYVNKVIYSDELEYPKDKEAIMEKYLDENFSKEMLSLLTSLREESNINYFQKDLEE